MGGLVNLFKYWGKGIGRAADKFLLNADARKAISDEVISKYKPKIELARRAESRRADNIKDLDTKLTESKKALADAKKAWKDNYDSALAGAKAQRQKDIDAYDARSKAYQDAVNSAKADKKSILAKLEDSEANYNQYSTIFTDVNTGKSYIIDPYNGGYRSLDSLSKKELKDFKKNYRNFDNRLIDFSTNPSGKVINAFNKSDFKQYGGKYSFFDRYYSNRISPHNADIRNAEDQITRAKGDFNNWKTNNSRPTDWDDSANSTDLSNFDKNFKANNAQPTEYSFNGQTYANATELDKAYNKALAHEQALQDSFSKSASRQISDQKAEIARRIQDAKNTKKAKLALGALGAGVGAGALYAGAKAMYGGDDTDNSETPDNIDTTDNTYTGKPDPNINIENTHDGKDALNGRPLKIDTDFNPYKADALAAAAYDEGVEDGNSVGSSADLGNNIVVSTRGHTMDDRLYELIKAMQDPYKADAVANYIYSKHGDDLEVQNLGWRGWLNKYYGDSLRSIMNIDPSGYKGMHVSGGL